MNISSTLRVTALGLVLSSRVFAQNPPPIPLPTPPNTLGATPTPSGFTSPLRRVTQSSRIRAFNAGPDGEVRSLYLQNGSVVDVTPDLGRQLGLSVRRGERITVSGAKSEIDGQSLLEASSIRLNDQTFSSNALPLGAPRLGALAEGVPPPPPGTPKEPLPPSPRSRGRAVPPAPCGVLADAPPPPPNTGGPPPPPADGIAPPSPPPNQTAAPPPSQN